MFKIIIIAVIFVKSDARTFGFGERLGYGYNSINTGRLVPGYLAYRGISGVGNGVMPVLYAIRRVDKAGDIGAAGSTRTAVTSVANIVGSHGSNIVGVGNYGANVVGIGNYGSNAGVADGSNSGDSYSLISGAVAHSGGPIQAAVSSRQTIEVVPIQLTQQPVQPQVIDIEPSDIPIILNFNSRSSRVIVQQNHIPAVAEEVQTTNSEDEPYRLMHHVIKPVIQEVREVITPFRQIVQEVRPVVEQVHTIVAQGQAQSQGHGQGQGHGASESSGGLIVATPTMGQFIGGGGANGGHTGGIIMGYNNGIGNTVGTGYGYNTIGNGAKLIPINVTPRKTSLFNIGGSHMTANKLSTGRVATVGNGGVTIGTTVNASKSYKS